MNWTVKISLRRALSTVLVWLLAIAFASWAIPALAVGDGTSATVAMPVITPEMRQYSHIRYALYFITIAYGCLIQLILIATGLSANIRDRAEKYSKKAWAQFLIYYVDTFVFMAVLISPLHFIANFVIEHRYGLTDQTFLAWSIDSLKMVGVAFCVTLILFAAFFWLVRRFPRKWSIYFCAFSCVYIAVVSFLAPIIIEPVIDTFTPLPKGTLRTRIEQLSAQAGAPNAPIYVSDKSKETSKLNAYVSGLGGSTHIVIWDTTLAKLPQDQVLAIVGHELGHFYLHHIYFDFAIAVGVNILLIPVNMFLAEPFARRLPKSWRIRGLSDFAIMPALSLVMIAGSFLTDPISNAWSRKQEHDADAFSIKVTENGPALARSFVALSEQNLSEPDPSPFIEFWLFSHPSLKERIDFALGQPEESKKGRD